MKTREQMILELSNTHVPGHGPDYSKLSDKELKERIAMNDKIFQILFKEKKKVTLDE